jgi:FkbM family methyltransferase
MKLTKYQRALKIFNLLPIFLKNSIIFIFKALNYKKEKYSQDLHYSGVFTTEIGNGANFKMFSSGGTLENKVFWYGINGYEPESLIPWIYFSKNSNAIVDIGANVGIYSLTSKAANANATVINFEPSDAIYKKLTNNIKLNNHTNVKANKVGVSDTTGTLLFYDIDAQDHSSASFSADKIKNTDPTVKLIEHQVEVIRLDDYIAQNNIDKIDLIKIDVELFEKQVLVGAINCLKNHRPIVFFEVLTDEVSKSLQEILSSLNYSLYHLNIENSKPNAVKVDVLYVNQQGLWNFLAIPSEDNESYKNLSAYLNNYQE